MRRAGRRFLAAETAQAEQNALSQGGARPRPAAIDAEFERLRALVAEKKAETAAPDRSGPTPRTPLRDLLLTIPNLPLPEVPDGRDEHDNVELRRWGTPRAFDFAPKEHFDIPGVKPGMDFETAAKLSGSRFVVLRGAVIRVHRALAQFMLDTHITEHGLTETWTPVLVKDEAMYRHQPVAEIRRGQLSDHQRLVAHPDLRSHADQHRRGRHPRRKRRCPSA